MICQHPKGYFCPTSGEDECPDCGGFDVCCAAPDEHVSARDIPPPVPLLAYWLNPRNWRTEARCWLAETQWRAYCFQHDVIHWSWTHRNCCARNRALGERIARAAGLVR